MTDSNTSRSGLMRYFPPAQWLAGYRAPWLRGDIVAGVTLAAYAIPVSLAYAGLAGLPPQVGVYGYLLGGLGYALLGSSRQLAIGPDLRHLAHDCRHRGSDGRWGRAALRGNRQPRRLHRGSSLPDRLAIAAKRARKADQRQHPRGLQGRRGIDHRHDPAAKPAWRCRWRAQFL